MKRKTQDRAPKSAGPKSAGAPTWMVTFGDLMALLFTLFVLLFTYSTLDVEKYKALAGSLREAFGSSFNETLTSDQPGSIEIKSVPEEVSEEDLLVAAKEAQEQRTIDFENTLKKTIAENLPDTGIEVDRESGIVTLRFPSEIAFLTGSADITLDFEIMLHRIAEVLVEAKGTIIVGGHTDNVPLSPGAHYKSNWELSAGRAAAVALVLLENKGISPQNLTIQGFGDSRPRIDNETIENRAMNRRVEISILIDDNTVTGQEQPTNN